MHNYINFVNSILDNSSLSEHQKKSVIIKILKVLCLNIQNNRVEQLLPNLITKETLSSFPLFPLYFKCPNCYFRTDYNTENIEELKCFINLNAVPVIASLWNPDRMLNAFATIGKFANNPFKYDPSNHFSNLFIYPIGLCQITNGLHSATTGIYDTSASVQLHSSIDISSSYKEITFDGIDFIHQKCQKSIYTPKHNDIGIIYEIGRLLIDKNIAILPTDYANLN